MKTKQLAISLFAACMLVLTACGSSSKIVEDNPKFATMPDVPAMVEMHAAEGQTIQGLTKLVVRSPYAMQQALTAWAQANNRPVPKSGSQAWAEAFRDISLGLVDLGKGATPWLAQAYTVKQWADVLTNIKPTVTTTTNTTTTSGDTMGDNANNSGTMQTGDGRINSNDATATPTVVTQPAPVIVQPQVVEPTVVQVPDSGGSSQ